MSNELDSKPAKLLAFLVTFEWDVNTVRYAGYTSDVVIGADTYTALPALKIQNLKLTGSIKDEIVKVLLPRTLTPALTLARAYPHAEVTVYIDEVNPANTSTCRQLYMGRVSKVRLGSAKQNKVVTLELTRKSVFETPLGIICTSTCAWPKFGAGQCNKNPEDYKVTTTIQAIDGFTVTLAATLPDQRRLHRGYLEKDSCKIMIRAANFNICRLIQKPPPEWQVGDAIVAYASCDKSIARCRYWGNESQFLGLGIAMLGYNPQFGIG